MKPIVATGAIDLSASFRAYANRLNCGRTDDLTPSIGAAWL
jgi:hypothetical protein